MDPEDEQRKRLLIYFKDFDCVEYKFLQSFFGDINVDEDHEDENRAKDELNVEKIHNEKEVNVFEFDHDHHDYEWDDAGHLYWYSTDNNQEEFEDIFDDPVPESEFLDDNPWSILSSLALSPVHSLDNDSVSDCELMSHHILEMQNNEATGECLGSHDGATETVNLTETKQSRYDANTESELSTAEPDPVPTVPFRDSLQDNVDRDHMELSQLQMQLPLPKLYYNLDPAHVTASDYIEASTLLGTCYYAVYQTSTTAVLLYEPDPLWLDLVALAYTLDHCTAALKLLLDGPKLVLSSIKVTDVAKAHLALLVVNNYNKIFSTYSYNRYHKFNVKSLVSASLAMLLMLYVANVMYGHTLFMSQHMLLTHLFAMAASVGVFLLVYNKLIFTTSGEYLKLLASACFTLQTALSAAIMVSFTVLLLPLFRLDTGTVLKVDRDYLLLHEKTAAKLHAFPSYKSCMFQNYYDLSIALMYATDTIIATYHVDWGARNFYLENLVVLASLYLFNEDYADVTVPLPLQDSCLLPSSDIVSEAKSPFVLVEVEPDSCQLLLGFHASAPLTNCLYFVDEVDLTQAHHGYPAFYCTTECIAASHTSCAQLPQVLGSDPRYFANNWDQADMMRLPASYFKVTLLQLHGNLAHLLFITALYLFNEDYADVTVPLPLQDSCLLPSSDIVSEAELLVEMEPGSCQLLPVFLASVPLTNRLYFVDEAQADLPPLHLGYTVFVLLTNALYLAVWTTQVTVISELAQLMSKLPSPLLSVTVANMGITLHSAEHTASKLLGPDLDTFASRVQVDTNVMMLPAIPYVDVTMLASLRYFVRAH